MPKLLFIVIDGLRSEALACAHIRCLNKLMRDGATAPLDNRSDLNLTLPALATAFTSVPPDTHGVTENVLPCYRPALGCGLPATLHYHHLTCAMFYSRDQLIGLFPPETLDTALLINSHAVQNVDRKLGEAAAAHLQREAPDFCFLYLQGCDIAGTHFGYLSEPYLESIEQADQSIGILLQQLQFVGLQQEYVVMVLAGHNGSWSGNGEREPLPWIICGPGIAETGHMQLSASAMDLAPTIAHLLHIAPQPSWQGRIIWEIFSATDHNAPSSSRQEKLHLLDRAGIRSIA